MKLLLSNSIGKQAIYNFGTAGHVMHGKSTLVASITGTKTQKHKKELERNCTINLGYANAKLYLDETGKIIARSTHSKPESGWKLLYHISFVDCPGHQSYMATMISGSNIMDHALVVVAANEKIPQPQTHQHIIALEYSGVAEKTYILNKMDLIKKRDAESRADMLHEYLDALMGGEEKQQLCLPISAATGENVDRLCQYLAGKVAEKIPQIMESAKGPLYMSIVRSYNVNKPNTPLADMIGAVVGGTISSGVLSVGDQIELRPGVVKMQDGKKVLQPLVAWVVSLESDRNGLTHAIPGGLVGVNLSLYAGLSNSDRLKGQVLGHVGTLPDMYDQIKGKYRILDFRTGEDEELPTITRESSLNLVVNGIMNTKATIVDLKAKKHKGTIVLKLECPVVMDLSKENNIALMMGGLLVASLKVQSGDLSMEVVYPEGTDMNWKPQEWNIVNDLEEFVPDAGTEDLSQWYDNISYRTSKKKKEEIFMPTVTMVNKSSFISKSDMEQLVASVTFPEADTTKPTGGKPVDLMRVIVDNIRSEFTGSVPRFNGDGNLALTGRIKTAQCSQFLRSFQNKLLTCPSCRGTRTSLFKVNRTIQRVCHKCPSVTYLHSTEMSKI